MEVKEKQSETQKPQAVENATGQDGYTLDEVVQRSARRGGKRASRTAVVPLLLAIMMLGAATAFAAWYFHSTPVDLSGYNASSEETNFSDRQKDSGMAYPIFTHATDALDLEQVKGMSTDDLNATNAEDADIDKCLLAPNADPDSEWVLPESKDNNVLTFWGDEQQEITGFYYYLSVDSGDETLMPYETYPTEADVYFDGEYYGTVELLPTSDDASFYYCELDAPKTVSSVTLEFTKWAKNKGTTDYYMGQVAFEGQSK